MENKKPIFKPNTYVLFRVSNEWREGRIVDIVHDPIGSKYLIRSFDSFTNIFVDSDDSVIMATAENRKRMRLSPFVNLPEKTHIPASLTALLVVDKEWCASTRYEMPASIPITRILTEAEEFITKNGAADHDEIHEIFCGFRDCFNFFLPRFLLYQNELDQFKSINETPCDYYGAIHLLRLIFFLQNNGRRYIDTAAVEMILLDYTIFLLDYLLEREAELF